MNGALPERVILREVCPRDGLQNVAAFVSTQDKLRIVRALADAGCREIEVTSVVSERVVPQFTDAAEVLNDLAGAAFARAVLVPTAARAERAIALGADRLVVFLSASEAHNRANVNRSVAESLAGVEDICSLASGARVPVLGAVAVSFGCPYEGDVPRDRVLAIAAELRRAGCTTLILGDTVGLATPRSVERIVKAFQDRFGDDDFSLHFHNNRGTAMTNLYAAMQSGAFTFDTALGGVGGCPTVPEAAGNLATEDVVCLLHRLGVETGLDLARLVAAARMLEEILGYGLPGQVMKGAAAGAAGRTGLKGAA